MTIIKLILIFLLIFSGCLFLVTCYRMVRQFPDDYKTKEDHARQGAEILNQINNPHNNIV